jgi:O-antigen ligase
LNSLYFLVVSLTVVAHALSADTLYKLFQFVCLCITFILAYRSFQMTGWKAFRLVLALLLYPTFLVILAPLAGTFPSIKYSYQFLCYASIPIGLLFASNHKGVSTDDRRRTLQIAQLFVFGYAALQSITTFLLDMPNGTLKNPHYLAQYCLLLLFVSLFLLQQLTMRWQRFLLILAMLTLGALLIHSWSRPAWLALTLTCALFFLLQRHRFGWRMPGMIVAAMLLVYTLNTGGVRDRINDLALNLAQEERVTIWRNAIDMQIDSTPRQWFFGHGIGHFLEDFKSYSEFHAQGVKDFATPHNYLIEILYSIGLMGLVASGIFVFVLYWHLYKEYRRCNRSLYISTLISILTANLLFTSITISYFRSFNLLILALIGGLLIVHTNAHASDHHCYS